MRSRLTLLGLGLPVLLLLLGFAYEGTSGWLERRRQPPPGRLVDVGGHRLHVSCSGSGPVTVVLEAGAANGSLSWYKVQPEIAKYTRACAYDRAGHGWSDSGPRPRVPSVIAGELHVALKAASIPAPYVIVGHSLGGLYARMFATRFRDDVAALVLVDSSHTDQFDRLPPALQTMDGRRRIHRRLLGAPVGIPRLFGWEFCGGGPPAIRDALHATECRPRFYRTLMEELGGDVGTPEWNAAVSEVAALGPLGSLPLTVITADPDRVVPGLPDDVETAFRKAIRVEMPQALAALSSRARLVAARDSGHMVPYDRPDVIVEEVRTHVPTPVP